MNDLKTRQLIRANWIKAEKYNRLAERLAKRIKSFGILRFLFFWKFKGLHARLVRLETFRTSYAMVAIAMTKKLTIMPMSRMDH